MLYLSPLHPQSILWGGHGVYSHFTGNGCLREITDLPLHTPGEWRILSEACFSGHCYILGRLFLFSLFSVILLPPPHVPAPYLHLSASQHASMPALFTALGFGCIVPFLRSLPGMLLICLWFFFFFCNQFQHWGGHWHSSYWIWQSLSKFLGQCVCVLPF